MEKSTQGAHLGLFISASRPWTYSVLLAAYIIICILDRLYLGWWSRGRGMVSVGGGRAESPDQFGEQGPIGQREFASPLI